MINLAESFGAYFGVPFIKPVLTELYTCFTEGSICIEVPELEKMISGHEGQVAHLIGNARQEDRPFVFHDNRLYFQRYFKYETRILEGIRKLIVQEHDTYSLRAGWLVSNRHLLQDLFPESTDIDWQKIGVIAAALNNFMIISGGPGTGKTTTVARVLALLFSENNGLKIALAAPTGKAANRMSESLKKSIGSMEGAGAVTLKEHLADFQPATIHKLLGTRRDSIYFKHNAGDPLDYDVVIVDEASMIDVALFAKLMDALPEKARLILLGDKDQLASVEAGSIFGDLCKAAGSYQNQFSAGYTDIFLKTGALTADQIPSVALHQLFAGNILTDHIVFLQQSHRFDDTKGIGKLSRAVINSDWQGVQHYLTADVPDPHVVMVPEAGPNPYFHHFVEKFGRLLQEPDILKALAMLQEAIILCAVNEGRFGVAEMNRQVERMLDIRDNDGAFYQNRPVVITRSDTNAGVLNGQTGLLRKSEEGRYYFCFIDDTGILQQVLLGLVPAYSTAYAMTIHKSQGSEFAEVYVVLPSHDEHRLISAELLYTALTRARDKVYVQAGEDIIKQTLKTSARRVSGLIQRLDKEA